MTHKFEACTPDQDHASTNIQQMYLFQGRHCGLACHQRGVAAGSQFSCHEAILRRAGHLQLGSKVMTWRLGLYCNLAVSNTV